MSPDYVSQSQQGKSTAAMIREVGQEARSHSLSWAKSQQSHTPRASFFFFFWYPSMTPSEKGIALQEAILQAFLLTLEFLGVLFPIPAFVSNHVLSLSIMLKSASRSPLWPEFKLSGCVLHTAMRLRFPKISKAWISSSMPTQSSLPHSVGSLWWST